MANTKFDAKSFNPEAFRYMVGRVPNLKMNEIVKSKALVHNPDVQATFSSENGTGYARIAMRGLLDGEAVNYDGATNIEATSTKTFEQGMVTVGRAKAWVEKDFSFDIIGGVDFMQNVADQVAAFVNSLKIERNGNMLTLEIVNPVEYASYVEYGHRTANGKGWVPGRFMLTISEREVQKIAPGVLEKKLYSMLKGLF